MLRKRMKKALCFILTTALLVPMLFIGAHAEQDPETPVQPADTLESAFAEGENSLIVFVTGIGQSFTYQFEDSYLQEGAFENGTLADYENYAPLIAEGKYVNRWNLFSTSYQEALAQSSTKKTIVKLVFQLLGTLFLRKNLVKDDDLRSLLRAMFKYNFLDEQGNSDPHAITPRYTCPVSAYPYGSNGESEAKGRFYASIPCADIAREKLGENYEDYLYCFNYSPFSYPTKNVEGLHEFIETILAENTVGADKVVLIPMSMGASVVSAYLNVYPDVADNHVRRVVSIVGAWNGSDLGVDLLTNNYADNSADLFYNGIIADMVGAPWGYVVNIALRLFSKSALRSLIDHALPIFTEELICKTPSLFCIVPAYAYEELSGRIPDENVKAQTDFYYSAQSTLPERFAALEAQGITFSFIAGYGLPYGAVTHDYKAFGFMHSAARTNSDEIINIESTVPGAESVAYDQQFADTAGRVLSPDGSVDIANALFKDSSWLFHGQKHELEHNNTAITLAIELALGNVKTVADCDDAEEDGVYFPQFNEKRDVNALTRNYLPAMRRYLAAGGTLTPEQQAKYDAAVEMLARTVNDPEEDDRIIEDLHGVLIELGVSEAPAAQSKFDAALDKALEKNNSFIERVFGSKGFLDFTK
ncbi:MAG: hypothetical protein IJJ85_05230 [Clostridia bacterium]|nr:hypothetical protein [Clostridia bacterium]